MLMTQPGITALHSREGVRLKAYLDSVGVPTIGWGHTKGVLMGQTITLEQAEKFFLEDLDSHAAPILAAVKVPLADHQKDALISIAFNIGVGAFKKSTFLKRINAGASPKQIADAIMMWKVPEEIIGRRRAEVNQFFTPYDVALPTQTAKKLVPASQVGATVKPGPAATVPADTQGNPIPPRGGWAEDSLPAFEVRAIQQTLRDRGWQIVGMVDGKWGTNTTAAVKALQEQAAKEDPSIIVDGHYGPQTKKLLADADLSTKVISEERKKTSASDLAAIGTPGVVQGRKITFASVGSILMAVASFGVALAQGWQAQPDTPWYGTLIGGFLPPWAAPILIVVFNIYNVAKSQGMIGQTVERFREGIDNSGRPASNPGPTDFFGSLFGRKS